MSKFEAVRSDVLRKPDRLETELTRHDVEPRSQIVVLEQFNSSGCDWRVWKYLQKFGLKFDDSHRHMQFAQRGLPQTVTNHIENGVKGERLCATQLDRAPQSTIALETLVGGPTDVVDVDHLDFGATSSGDGNNGALNQPRHGGDEG